MGRGASPRVGKRSTAAINRRRAVLFLVALSVCSVGGAVAIAADSQQIWLDYNASYRLSAKTSLYGDVGLRHDLVHTGLWQLVVRPGVSVPVGEFRLTAGIGNFFTFADRIADRWEIRPFQGAAVTWPRGRIAFDHYLRAEQLFNFNTENWHSLNSLRLRYRLQASYRWDANRDGGFWRVAASVEPFVVLASEQDLIENKIRAAIGIERSLGAARRLKFEIIWQQARLFFLPGEPVQNIFFRVRWYRRW